MARIAWTKPDTAGSDMLEVRGVSIDVNHADDVTLVEMFDDDERVLASIVYVDRRFGHKLVGWTHEIFYYSAGVFGVETAHVRSSVDDGGEMN